MKRALLQIRKAGGTEVARRCVHARDVLGRLVGLLGHHDLPAGEALLLEPCNQVHTFFMNFPIDAVFLAADNRVVACTELKAWRLSKMHFKARKVLELPYGTCATLGLKAGDILEISSC